MNETELTFISYLVNDCRAYNSLLGNFKREFLTDDKALLIWDTCNKLQKYDLIALRNELCDKMDLKLLMKIWSLQPVYNDIMFKCYAIKLVEDWKTRQKTQILNDEGVTTSSMQKVDEIENFALYPVSEEDVSEEYLKRVEGKYTGVGDKNIIPTGFSKIDSIMEGLGKSELIFLAGNSGAGKTTLAINIAYNIARTKKKVLFFSLEMKETELHERLVKNIANVSDYTKMSQDDFNKVVKTSRAVKDRLSIEVNDKNITIEAMYSILKGKQDVDVVFIDHLNILTADEKIRDKLERLEYLTRRLKEMAKELNIPIVCLCQLNRANSDREIKRPLLSDLRGSGSIEQDANIVLFVYSPEYYLLQSKPDETSKNYLKWEEEYLKSKGKTSIIVAKNRRGKIGDAEFIFEKDYCRFTEV